MSTISMSIKKHFEDSYRKSYMKGAWYFSLGDLGIHSVIRENDVFDSPPSPITSGHFV
jgi:hypothetical protein